MTCLQFAESKFIDLRIPKSSMFGNKVQEFEVFSRLLVFSCFVFFLIHLLGFLFACFYLLCISYLRTADHIA